MRILMTVVLAVSALAAVGCDDKKAAPPAAPTAAATTTAAPAKAPAPAKTGGGW